MSSTGSDGGRGGSRHESEGTVRVFHAARGGHSTWIRVRKVRRRVRTVRGRVGSGSPNSDSRSYFVDPPPSRYRNDGRTHRSQGSVSGGSRCATAAGAGEGRKPVVSAGRRTHLRPGRPQYDVTAPKSQADRQSAECRSCVHLNNPAPHWAGTPFNQFPTSHRCRIVRMGSTCVLMANARVRQSIGAFGRVTLRAGGPRPGEL